MPDCLNRDATLTALRLTVNNHPGVMSHVCGLFARRAFNLEGILVAPVDRSCATCDILLLVNEDARLEQLVSQVRKLHDVIDIRADPADDGLLDRLQQAFPH